MAKRVSKTDMRQTELQKTIMSMSGRYTAYEIFMDWIECSALAISNALDQFHGKLWRDREEKFSLVMQKYTPEEQAKFPEMLAWLIEELEDNPRDVLGEVFMRSGMGSDAGGQFFTPFNISQCMSELTVSIPKEGEKISMAEPSCGSGGSIIAAEVYESSSSGSRLAMRIYVLRTAVLYGNRCRVRTGRHFNGSVQSGISG